MMVGLAYVAAAVGVWAAALGLYVLGLLAYDEVSELFASINQTRLRRPVSAYTLIPVSSQRLPGAANSTSA